MNSHWILTNEDLPERKVELPEEQVISTTFIIKFI